MGNSKKHKNNTATNKNKNSAAAKNGANNKVSTVQTIEKQNKLEYIAVNILSLFVFVAFAYIAIMSFIQTSVIDPASYSSEVILYQTDNVALNLLFTALFAVFAFKMNKHCDFFAKLNIKVYEICLVAFVAIIGFVWIFSVTSIPAADSYNLFETATGAAKGVYPSLHNGQAFYNSDYYGGYSYYNFYPFQLGFVFISEIVYRIFGTSSSMPIQVINVLCVAVTYLGIARITRRLFNKLSIEFFAIILLAGCFQPILFSTFVYGNIIGMCCAVWASYFLIKYFQTNKYTALIPCGLLLVVSTLAKYNNMIYLVAFAIMLIIHTIIKKKWQSVAFALAICIATVGASNLIIISYESRANVDLTSGVSQTLYLDMGLNESYMAPGWYNAIAMENYKSHGCDAKLSSEQAWADINSRLSKMGSDPEYAIDFFSKKILSQWNEPSYESIWISKVKNHTNELGAIGNAMYGVNGQGGSLGQLFELYFNLYMQILFVLFAVGIYFLFLNKKTNIMTVLLPLVLLGAFGYHLLFEGKSQYIFAYVPLLIPTAAYALSCILNEKYTRIKQTVKSLKTIPKKGEN